MAKKEKKFVRSNGIFGEKRLIHKTSMINLAKCYELLKFRVKRRKFLWKKEKIVNDVGAAADQNWMENTHFPHWAICGI